MNNLTPDTLSFVLLRGVRRVRRRRGLLMFLGLVAAAVTGSVAQAKPPFVQPGQVSGASGKNRIRLIDPVKGPLYPVNVNNWWGLMDQRGYLVVYPRFDWTDDSYDDLIRAVQDGKTGYLNELGDWYVRPRLAYADRFQNGYAIVGDGKKFGFIDRAAHVIVPIKLDGALRFTEGFAAVRIGDRCGFIDVRGKVVIKPRFARVRQFHDGLAMVQLPGPITAGKDGEANKKTTPGMLGYIDQRGEFVQRDRRGRFNDLGDFHHSLARAKVGDKWGYVDQRMQLRIQPRFEDARDFVGKLAAVKLHGKWGYVNAAGSIVVQPRFDGADDFDETLAMIQVGGKFGYVNRNGTRGLKPIFTRARPFFRQFARVAEHPPAFGYVDQTGHVIWNPNRAERGFVDVTTREAATRPYRRFHRANRVIAAPPPRKARPIPYLPDYLYKKELPKKMR